MRALPPRVEEIGAQLLKELREARRSLFFSILLLVWAGLVVVEAQGFVSTSSVLPYLPAKVAAYEFWQQLLPVFGIFGLLGAVSISTEREHGTWDVLRASRVPLSSVLVGKFLFLALAGLVLVVLADSALFGSLALRGFADPSGVFLTVPWISLVVLPVWAQALFISSLFRRRLDSAISVLGVALVLGLAASTLYAQTYASVQASLSANPLSEPGYVADLNFPWFVFAFLSLSPTYDLGIASYGMHLLYGSTMGPVNGRLAPIDLGQQVLTSWGLYVAALALQVLGFFGLALWSVTRRGRP